MNAYISSDVHQSLDLFSVHNSDGGKVSYTENCNIVFQAEQTRSPCLWNSKLSEEPKNKLILKNWSAPKLSPKEKQQWNSIWYQIITFNATFHSYAISKLMNWKIHNSCQQFFWWDSKRFSREIYAYHGIDI